MARRVGLQGDGSSMLIPRALYAANGPIGHLEVLFVVSIASQLVASIRMPFDVNSRKKTSEHCLSYLAIKGLKT